jgi:2-polyprenyl-3-methyl-5-hydroxy-6-metoxy-1,4-benzoquinol methylase
MTFPHDIEFQDEDYLDHENWVRYCFQRLGNVGGKTVLDYGCGAGFGAVVLARKGAKVFAFDASEDMVLLSRKRAHDNHVDGSVHVEIMAAEELHYRDSQFDAVYGNAIMHHVHLPKACPELRRVMKPGAVAVFAEPFGENPLLELTRQYVPYPGKNRTPEEQPLKTRDLLLLAQFFEVTTKEFQLLSMIRRLVRRRGWIRVLEGVDERLFSVFPFLRRFARYVVVELKNKSP